MSPLATPRVVPADADADDDHVIAAAVAGSAELVVSGDRHLLALGSHQGIDVVTVSDALGRIGAGSGPT